MANLVYFANQPTRVIFLDVGQGDSMLIIQGDIEILVDVGPGDYVVQEITKYIPFYDTEIEYVVITHPHFDHFGGIFAVLKRYSIANIVLSTGDCEYDSAYTDFISSIPQNTKILRGLKLKIGALSFLAQKISDNNCGRSNHEINDQSLISYIKYNDIEIINMGDLESDLENMVNYKNVDILKAGHHCSDTSSSNDFVSVVSPKFVVCSVGLDNKYGHPSKSIIDMFKSMGIKIFLTYDTGNIVVNLESKVIYNEKNKIIGKL